MWRQMYNINIILWYPVGCVSFSFTEQNCFQCPAFSLSVRLQMTCTLFRLWSKPSESLNILKHHFSCQPCLVCVSEPSSCLLVSDFLRLLPAEFCTLAQIANRSHGKYFVTQPICRKPCYNHCSLMMTSISASIVSVLLNAINMNHTDWMWSVLHGSIEQCRVTNASRENEMCYLNNFRY